VSLVVGVVLIGLASYVPTYVQGVLGTGALVAGLAVASMTLGWPIAASLSGRLYLRVGFRDTALFGSVFLLAGGGLVALLTSTSSVWSVAAACFVVGLGLGLVSAPTMVAVQSAVGWADRGVATAANMFFRNVGSAVGVAVFGAIANATLAARFADPSDAVAGRRPATGDAERLLVAGHRATGEVAAFLRDALFDASRNVFLGVAAASVLVVAALLVMPRRPEAADD
jgi:MFS family permease